MFRLQAAQVRDRRRADPCFSATSQAVKILRESLHFDMGERRFLLRRDPAEVDDRIRELVASTIASGDLRMFANLNSGEVTRVARQAAHFSSAPPQDDLDALRDQARGEGLLLTSILVTAASGGDEGVERSAMALAQGCEIGVLAGLDVLQAAGYLRDLGHPNTSREVIRVTRLLHPDDPQIRDRAEDLLASLPLEVLRDVLRPREELELDQGRLLVNQEEDKASSSGETERYVPSPLPVEEYVPSDTPVEFLVPSPEPQRQPDIGPEPRGDDQGANGTEDTRDGQRDQSLDEERPVGRVPAQQRQGVQASPQREVEVIDYR